MRKPNGQKIAFVHKGLLAWYKKHYRLFFWRTTTDPYVILVSEIMLQQTQSSRVEEKLQDFIKRFPDFQTLAKASKSDVIRSWRGMGYNNRAIRLRELALRVVEQYGSRLPQTTEELLLLPGIGKYTAHAVQCFGFRKSVSVVDINIQRVLSRVFTKVDSLSEMLPLDSAWELAGKVLPKDTYTWNQALMELGSTVCKARSASCHVCPLVRVCSSRHLEEAKALNISKEKKEKMYEGIPLRLWRGKIVEVLRSVDDMGSISLNTLGKKVKKNYQHSESVWLKELIDNLEKDGIVQKQQVNRSLYIKLAE